MHQYTTPDHAYIPAPELEIVLNLRYDPICYFCVLRVSVDRFRAGPEDAGGFASRRMSPDNGSNTCY